jgi:hypothetical protein
LGFDELFEGRHFDREIIVLCVRWYLRFKLSFRDLVEMMAERGLSMGHTTIMRWVHRYAPSSGVAGTRAFTARMTSSAIQNKNSLNEQNCIPWPRRSAVQQHHVRVLGEGVERAWPKSAPAKRVLPT